MRIGKKRKTFRSLSFFLWTMNEEYFWHLKLYPLIIASSIWNTIQERVERPHAPSNSESERMKARFQNINSIFMSRHAFHNIRIIKWSLELIFLTALAPMQWVVEEKKRIQTQISVHPLGVTRVNTGIDISTAFTMRRSTHHEFVDTSSDFFKSCLSIFKNQPVIDSQPDLTLVRQPRVRNLAGFIYNFFPFEHPKLRAAPRNSSCGSRSEWRGNQNFHLLRFLASLNVGVHVWVREWVLVCVRIDPVTIAFDFPWILGICFVEAAWPKSTNLPSIPAKAEAKVGLAVIN